jgi:hypothetical protein
VTVDGSAVAAVADVEAGAVAWLLLLLLVLL